MSATVERDNRDMECPYCRGTGKRDHWISKDEAIKRPCPYCKCFSDGAPCPYAESHGPDEQVILGRTVKGRDEKGRSVDKIDDSVIRYADWEFRCRLCYPR